MWWRWAAWISLGYNLVVLIMIFIFYHSPPRRNSSGLKKMEIIKRIDVFGRCVVHWRICFVYSRDSIGVCSVALKNCLQFRWIYICLGICAGYFDAYGWPRHDWPILHLATVCSISYDSWICVPERREQY